MKKAEEYPDFLIEDCMFGFTLEDDIIIDKKEYIEEEEEEVIVCTE